MFTYFAVALHILWPFTHSHLKKKRNGTQKYFCKSTSTDAAMGDKDGDKTSCSMMSCAGTAKKFTKDSPHHPSERCENCSEQGTWGNKRAKFIDVTLPWNRLLFLSQHRTPSSHK